MRPDDARYYRTRALQEQVAAQNAASEEARKCHAELATMYRFRAALLPPAPDPVFEGMIEAVD